MPLREILGLEHNSLVIKRGRLRWFGRVKYRDDSDCMKQCKSMETEGSGQKDAQKTLHWCVEDMTIFVLSMRMLQIRMTGE